ncbi:MAG: hypothetical protein QM737_08400 [Ferruginibacter sp.]
MIIASGILLYLLLVIYLTVFVFRRRSPSSKMNIANPASDDRSKKIFNDVIVIAISACLGFFLVSLFFNKTNTTPAPSIHKSYDSINNFLLSEQTKSLKIIAEKIGTGVLGPNFGGKAGEISDTVYIIDTTGKDLHSKFALHRLDSLIKAQQTSLSELKEKIESAGNYSLHWSTVVWFLLFLSFLTAFLWKYKAKSATQKAVLALGALLSLEKAFDSVFNNKFEFGKDSKIILYEKYIDKRRVSFSDKQEDLKIDVLHMSPFIEGDDKPDSLSRRLTDLQNELMKNGHKYVELDIYGGVDTRSLIKKARVKFGENSILSKARAEWVKKKILSYNMGIDSTRIFTYDNGASKIYDSYDSAKHADNRQVTIIAKYQ